MNAHNFFTSSQRHTVKLIFSVTSCVDKLQVSYDVYIYHQGYIQLKGSHIQVMSLNWAKSFDLRNLQ